MASTRNKYTRNNYDLEKRDNSRMQDWVAYTNGSAGAAYDPATPGNGLGGARISSSFLSRNATEIESFLFGIGSTAYLEQGTDGAPPVIQPEFTSLPRARLYQNPNIVVPMPLIVSKTNRPNIP